MIRWRALFVVGLLSAVLVFPTPPVESADDDTWKAAFIGPLSGPLAASGEESLLGLRAAMRRINEDGGLAGKMPVEVVPFDDGDTGPGALKALEAATKVKCKFVFAASTGVTAPVLAEKVRKGKLPAFFIGTAGPAPSIDVTDPVLSMASWPVDQALAAANFLAVRSTKEHLGLNGDTVEPALVVEDTPRGQELADALARNLGARQHLSGRITVAPHGTVDPAALDALRKARCDRLVLIGEPDLIDAVFAALDTLSWNVPLFCMDGMVSRAAKSLHGGPPRRVNLLEGLPQWFGGEPPNTFPKVPEVLREVQDEVHGKDTQVYSRSVQAYTALEFVSLGAAAGKSLRTPDLMASVRAVAYGTLEARMPVIDETGRAALFHWYLWKPVSTGCERINPLFLPQEGRGQLFGLLRTDRFKGEPGTKIVWLTFGDEESKPPRTIEKDMAQMGLGTRGYEGDLDAVLLDELMARSLSKLNRLFLRNLDGTGIPGVSYNISFTAEKPEGLKNHEYWKGVIAGDHPVAGGQAWAGEGRIEIYSTYMIRTDDKFRAAALNPKMDRSDKPYIDMTYAWGESQERNKRSDRIRSLVDGFASFFALTGAHELGHVAGLGHDEESGRSIMNVVEGAGLSEKNCWFIPSHTKVLERVLGRVGEKKK